jgi:hypothetical protein
MLADPKFRIHYQLEYSTHMYDDVGGKRECTRVFNRTLLYLSRVFSYFTRCRYIIFTCSSQS